MRSSKAWLLITLFTASFLYFYFVMDTQHRFTSPDESVNYHFLNVYQSNGTLFYVSCLSNQTDGLIRPRSTIGVGCKIAPTGFIGLPLILGSISVMDTELIFYLSPLIALVGLFAFYGMVKHIFGLSNARISIMLLMLLPPYWYWSTRSLGNNILAIVFLIFAISYFFKVLEFGNLTYYVLSAIFSGAALLTRPDNLLLLLPTVVITLVYKRTRLKLNYLLAASIMLLLFLLPILLVNKSTTGNYLTPAYLVSINQQSIHAGVWNIFNLNLNNTLSNLINYYVLFLPLFFVGALFGNLSILAKDHKTEKVKYCLFFSAISATTIFYWGGGVFYGIESGTPLLGSSYSRYFLPMYIFSIPVLTHFLLLSKKSRGRSILLLLFLTLITQAILFTLTTESGVIDLMDKRKSYLINAEFILKNTEPNAIIITNYWDKVIFPDRNVATPLYIENNVTKLANITIELTGQSMPVYLLKDSGTRIDYAQYQQNLLVAGYSLEQVNDSTLYKVIKNSKAEDMPTFPFNNRRHNLTGCKVIFSYDDISARFDKVDCIGCMERLEKAILVHNEANLSPIVLMAVPNYYGIPFNTSYRLINLLKFYYRRGLIDIELHGFNHISGEDLTQEFSSDVELSVESLRLGKKMLEAQGFEIACYRAPWFNSSSNLLNLLKQSNEFKCDSSITGRQNVQNVSGIFEIGVGIRDSLDLETFNAKFPYATNATTPIVVVLHPPIYEKMPEFKYKLKEVAATLREHNCTVVTFKDILTTLG